MKPVSRRALLGVSPLLAACETRRARYFGKTDPPRSQELVYLLGAEPGTLDPAKSDDLWEAPIIHAMFEGLTSIEPATGEPRAALATHYEADSNGLRYVFRLRGHPRPRGIAFAAAEGSGIPARWSDGRPITAHDFVYSWRRAVDPATAAPYAYLFHYIANGEAITAGRQPPVCWGAPVL